AWQVTLLGGQGEAEIAQLTAQKLVIEIDQRIESDLLSIDGDFAINSQVGQECLDLECASFCRVALVDEVNIASYPMQVGFLGFEAKTAKAHFCTNGFDKGTGHGTSLLWVASLKNRQGMGCWQSSAAYFVEMQIESL